MMKFFLIIALFVSVSCNESSDDLSINEHFRSEYSHSEKQILRCIEKVKETCRGASCFNAIKAQCSQDKKRTPASAQTQIQAQMLIEQNDWFFLNPLKIRKFINIFKELNSLRDKVPGATQQFKKFVSKKLHGRGIGFQANASFGISKKWTGELVIHNKSVALFCAPGNGFVSDAGVEAGIVGLSTLGCREHNDYQGTFLSASLGVSAEAFLIPIGLNLGYSFGVDSVAFNNEVRRLKSQNKIKFKDLMREISILNNNTDHSQLGLLNMVSVKLASFIFKEKDTLGKEEVSSQSKTEIKQVLKRESSLGLIYKRFIKSPEVQNILEKYQLENLSAFFNLVSVSLTGCDSISGGASLSLTASPVSIGFSQNYYTKVIQLSRNDLKVIANISLLSLANPFLLAPSLVPLIVDYANRLDDFERTILNCSAGDMKDFENFIYFSD